jgi:predicted transposase YdaD
MKRDDVEKFRKMGESFAESMGDDEGSKALIDGVATNKYVEEAIKNSEIGKQIKAEGFAQGKAKGKAEGKAEAEAEGKAEAEAEMRAKLKASGMSDEQIEQLLGE